MVPTARFDSAPAISPVGPAWQGPLVVLAALALAWLGAADHAGSWNDGSRLAAVESLVDHSTWAIDRSIFVRVPAPGAGPAPYPADNPMLTQLGTLDKLWIDGHFYSDKSPVPSLLLAGVYWALQQTTGLKAREQPDVFCRVMAFSSSGLAFVAAVWCALRLGGLCGLGPGTRLLLAGSLGLGTVCWPYGRYVNNHVLLLAVAMGLTLLAVCLARMPAARQPRACLGVGVLAGLGYTIDLAAGPLLLASMAGLVVLRCRRASALAWLLVGALPWLALHHGVNYHLAGTWMPANADPEAFRWPGCPFSEENMTGRWGHASAKSLVLYSLDLLVGKRGFLGHNVPLLAGLAGAAVLWRRRFPERLELAILLGWGGGLWLVYSALSTNHSGSCCSIRWLVPALAPGYLLLALSLRERPELGGLLALLTPWGVALGLLMAWRGPWTGRMVPGYWALFGLALVSCGWHFRRVRGAAAGPPPERGTRLHPAGPALRGPRGRHSRAAARGAVSAEAPPSP